MKTILKMTKRCRIAIFSVIILVTSVIANPIGVITAADINSGVTNTDNLKITNIATTNSGPIKDGQTIGISVSFKGNSKVKPGDKITLELPKANKEYAGLNGIETHIPLVVKGPNNEDIKNAATLNVHDQTVNIIFGPNIVKLTNGFTGMAQFQAQAYLDTDTVGINGKITVNTNWGGQCKRTKYCGNTKFW